MDTSNINIHKVKSPKTFEEQVAILKSKGVLIDDDNFCIGFLNKANYYRLSAYFLPFENTHNVNFNRIARIYDFDGKLRAIFFQCIEEIELYLKTQIAYFSAHNHGALGYLNENTFSNKHNHKVFLDLVDKCIKANEKTLVVQHHMEKYGGKFPIWVIIEFFSMGMLSYFYKDLVSKDQRNIAHLLYDTNLNCLKNWLRCITILRNKCAHYSRLYYWFFPAIPRVPQKINFTADRTLFSQIMMLKFLYPDKKRWNSKVSKALKALIKEYGDDIVLEHIGFPDNWKKLLRK